MADDGTIAQQATLPLLAEPFPERRPEHIHYPDSDGHFLPENPIHARAVINLRSALVQHFATTENVVVEGDMFVYYEPDNPRASLAPDMFVVLDHDLGSRLTYKIWEEGKPPDFALEVISPSSDVRNAQDKVALYAHLGIREYVRFQPELEGVEPRLVGYRLRGRSYGAVMPDAAEAIHSRILGVSLRAEGTSLRVRSLATGKEYSWLEELHRRDELLEYEVKARQRAEARAEYEAEVRRQAQAEARAAQAEARAEAEARRQAQAEARAEAEARRQAQAEAKAAQARAAELEALILRQGGSTGRGD